MAQPPVPPPPPLLSPSSCPTTPSKNTPIRLNIKSQEEVKNLQTAHLTAPDRQTPRPGWYFFYGTLMNPSLVATILELEQEPMMRQAKVQHFKLKKWGKYPALVPGTDNDEVQGTAWKTDLQEHAERLAKYETRAYDVVACKILFTNKDSEGDRSQESVDGWTFVSSFAAERLKNVEGSA